MKSETPGANNQVGEGEEGEIGLWKRLEPNPTVVACLFCLVYISVLSWLSIQRHFSLLTQMNDLGNMTQAIWTASQGYLSMPVSNVGPLGDPHQTASRLLVHGNFIFYLFAALFALLPGLVEHMQSLLLAGTSAACGAAGLGIFFYARHHFDGAPWLALLIACAFWLNPRVHDANLYDFHIITFTTAFLIWMVYAWETGKDILGWALFVLALLCKEDVFLILTALGIGNLIWRDRRRGMWMVGISVAYAGLYFGLLQPFMTEAGPALPKPAARRFAWLGDGIGGIATTILTSPGVFFRGVFVDSFPYPYLTWGYLFGVLGGVVAVFGNWRLLIGAIPPLLIAMVADGPGEMWMQKITGTYYWFTSVGLLYLGCISAISSWTSEVWRRTAASYLLGGSFVASIFFSQTPLGLTVSMSDYRPVPTHRTSLGEIRAMVPDSAAVLAQNNIAVHFATRRRIRTPSTSFDPNTNSAGWNFFILHLDLHEHPNNWLYPAYLHLLDPEVPKLIIKFKRSPKWRCRYYENKFVVFERSTHGTDVDVDLDTAKRDILDLYNEFEEDVPWFHPRLLLGVEAVDADSGPEPRNGR